MNLIFPIFLIISSIGIFFGYVDPNYKGGSFVDENVSTSTNYSGYGVLSLKDELKKFEEISSNSNKIVNDRDLLIKKSNQITTSDKTKLNKFLPDSIDNIRLIIEISDMASARGLVAKNITINEAKKSNDAMNIDNSPYGTLNIKFSVNSTYENFLLFLGDLENNLRLFDVSDINFSASDTGFYDFSIGLKTYWLK
jgi:Tfp pilus assembly protein PilO